MQNFFKQLTKPKVATNLNMEIKEASPIPKPTIADWLFRKSVPLVVSAEDRELVGTYIKPDLQHGPWIAGGAVLRWYQNKPVGDHDVDVFVKNDEQFEQVKNNIINKLNGTILFNSDNASTYKVYINRDTPYKIQLIKHYCDSLKDCLDRFDFTVCKISTDGVSWVKGQNFDRDFESKSLVIEGGLRPDSIKRVVKYICYGYEPGDDLLDELYNDDNLKLAFSDDEDYRM